MTATIPAPKQAITGVTAPTTGESIIRVAWPSLAAYPAVATLGRKFILSWVLAPLGWGLMLPFYFLKVLPGLGTRYKVTNRRVMIQRGMRPAMSQEVLLEAIDEVRFVRDANSDFFRAATLEIVSGGQVKMTMPGVPEAEAFRHAILNACMAFVPGAPKKWLKWQAAK